MLQRIIITTAIALGFLVPIAVPVVTHAQLQDELCKGASLNVTDTCNAGDANADTKVNGVLKLAITLFSIVVGVISVIMIIVGGLKYITSGGESANVQGAKNTILYAVIGLVIVAMAQFVVQFVLKKASDVANG